MNTLNGTIDNRPIKRNVFTNPLIVKLSKVKENDADHSATYGGIAAKVIWFLVCVVAGVVCYLIISKNGGEEIEFFSQRVSKISLFGAAGGCVLLVLVPLLSFIFRSLIPFLGSLFCVSTGYVIAFAGETYGQEYIDLIWMALVITMILVATMTFLYFTGIVKVNRRFHTVVLCLFLCAILMPLLTFIMSFIPFMAPLASFVQKYLYESIIGSVVFVIIGCLMLMADFSTIQLLVDNKMSKKYEWLAAFSLAYTVIWLYLKVLDLLSKDKGEN